MDDYGLELSGLDPDTTAELRRLKRQQRKGIYKGTGVRALRRR